MSDQDLLEPRSRTLTSEMLKALVHSGSNWYTRFLPKILSEEIRAVPFAKRRQGCAYFRILYIFFLFFFFWTHAQLSKQCWMCDFDGHIYWKKVKEAENLLTCHLWCAFKAVDSICSIFPKELPGSSYLVFHLYLLYAKAFSLKFP